MKTTAVFALILASAAAFNAPQFATRAVGKKAPVKKVAVAKKVVAKKAPVKVAPVKKAPVKKAPVKKAPVKKAPVKKAPVKVAPVKKAPVKKAAAAAARAAPPTAKGYPSFAAAAQNFKLGSISGGGNVKYTPVFVHPTVNTAPAPVFDYKEAAKGRLTKNQVFAFDDGLTILERQQRTSLPAFLTGSAKSSADKSTIRSDIVEQEFAFGLDADRFQLLFITVFGLFTLVGCLSGSVSLD